MRVAWCCVASPGVAWHARVCLLTSGAALDASLLYHTCTHTRTRTHTHTHTLVQSKVLAKIEKPSAIDNLESITDVCDGIMVARGDLGVEVNIRAHACRLARAHTQNKRFLVQNI